MKTIPTSLFLLSFMLFIWSCQQEDVSPFEEEDTMIKHYSSIEVTVSLCNPIQDPFCDSLKALPGVLVKIFETEDDRYYGEPVIAEKTSDANGKVFFGNLERGAYYWFEAISSNYGTRYEVTTTPTNGTATVPIIFD